MSYIEMVGIYKIYPPDVIALKNVDLSLQKGEIHSIVGENGAGKSTLMKILYGLVKPSMGIIKINGVRKSITSPTKAQQNGIGMVHQEFMLIPSLRVYENILLGKEKTIFGFLKRHEMKKDVEHFVEKFGFNLDVDTITADLSVAAQQKVEILKVLYTGADILILDEPTAVLTPQESSELFEQLKKLKDLGKAIVFISHKLDEVLGISDRITILRKGEKVATVLGKDVSKTDLARMMIGKPVLFDIKIQKVGKGEPVLVLKNLTVKSKRKKAKALENVSIVVNSGEIVGIAAIEGNGQHELVQAVVGEIVPDSGEIKICDVDVSKQPLHKRRILMSYVPQDRKRKGLALKATIVENLIMTHHLTKKLRKGMILSWKNARKLASKIIEDFKVVCRNFQQEAATLSGGNQQKLVVGREFSLDTKLIVLDDPTRGLDVASTEYIRQLVVVARDSGKAILLVSSDLDELIALSDRIYVLREGKVVAEFQRSVDKETIGMYMLGVTA